MGRYLKAQSNDKPGPKPSRRDTPRGAAGTAKPPKELPPTARKVYRNLAAELGSSITDRDALALALASAVAAVGLQAAADLEREGLIEVDEAHKGTLRKSPLWTVLQQAAQTYLAYSDRLGANPRARVQFGGAGGGGGGAGAVFEKFMQREAARQQDRAEQPIQVAEEW